MSKAQSKVYSEDKRKRAVGSARVTLIIGRAARPLGSQLSAVMAERITRASSIAFWVRFFTVAAIALSNVCSPYTTVC